MHVALLRAINVGANRKVPMADLRDLFSNLGAREVRTYIQSGNVVYDGTVDLQTLEAALRARFGFAIPVVIRSAAALDTLVNPWPDTDPKIVGVAFLRDTPDAARVAALNLARIAPDELQVHGADVWVRCPTTFAKTKITVDWLDRSFATVATVRNVTTALLLREWANGRA